MVRRMSAVDIVEIYRLGNKDSLVIAKELNIHIVARRLVAFYTQLNTLGAPGLQSCDIGQINIIVGADRFK